MRDSIPRLRFGLVCAVILLLTALLGCGPSDIGHVEGRVTLDGQPVTNAVIVFESAARGVSVNAPLDSDGRFVLRTFEKAGLPPGDYQVAIRPGSFGSGEAPLVGVDGPPKPGAASAATTVPPMYQSVATSGLTAKVQLGANPPFQFELQSGAK